MFFGLQKEYLKAQPAFAAWRNESHHLLLHTNIFYRPQETQL